MYSNISQILLLYKMWWYYNKFDFTKSSRIYYWCVKIPQCGYMEHGLSYIIFYVQKHMKALTKCYNPNSRQAARTVGIYDTRLLAPLSNVNRPYSQIPQCTCPISLNTPFKIEMSTFLFWMVCCWTWDRCIVGFVRLVYSQKALRPTISNLYQNDLVSYKLHRQ